MCVHPLNGKDCTGNGKRFLMHVIAKLVDYSYIMTAIYWYILLVELLNAKFR